MVKDGSVITVQVFDQKKFKKKDQGFLGVINVPVSSALDLDLGGDGQSTRIIPLSSTADRNVVRRNIDSRTQEIE